MKQTTPLMETNHKSVKTSPFQTKGFLLFQLTGNKNDNSYRFMRESLKIDSNYDRVRSEKVVVRKMGR